MCGIAGFLHFDQNRSASNETIKKMTNTLIHRGPDGEGYYVKGNIALGHRRLSIIDLTTGDQPMESHNKKNVVVFNGEIYNYIELRSELESLGRKFHTKSDTEVIIQAFEQWGIDCQNKFNGMWAFALWDDHKQQLFVSRDRIGEKPIFYTVDDGTFIFGSEIKSLFAYGLPKNINAELLEVYLYLGYIPAPFTFYKGITKLQAGHYILVNDGNISTRKYWDLPEIDETNMLKDKADIYDNFNYLINDSVKIRMRSDVKFGAFLSGGLDSGSIVALMSTNSSIPVETFTIGFDEKAFDERELARYVAEKFHTNHHEYMVKSNSFDESLEKICNSFDEPFGDPSAIPTGYVSKYASQNVKMVLTGDGGDEVLSGYTSYQREKFINYYNKLPSITRKLSHSIVSIFSRILSGRTKQIAQRLERVLKSSDLSFYDRLIYMAAWRDFEVIKWLLRGSDSHITIEDYLSDFFGKYSHDDNFYKNMYFNLKVSLPEDMLVKVDRMSMSNSLETRVPFLDFRLIEFLVSVHKNIKMEGLQRKSILRNTIGKQLPKALLRAPKKGFVVPLDHWFTQNMFKPRIADMCQELNLLFNKDALMKICSKTSQGKNDHSNLLWSLFVLKGVMKN